jgi:hypothetical protein
VYINNVNIVDIGDVRLPLSALSSPLACSVSPREKARSSRHDIVSRCVSLEVGVDTEGSQVEDAAARGRGYVIYCVTYTQ